MDKKRVIIISMFIISFLVAILLSSFYYNDKYSIYFETGTEDKILTQYVVKNEKVKKPIQPSKEGYIFKEWQLNGKTYNFDEEIKSDIILTAKWVKEEYVTISFNTNSDTIIESKKILKGDSLEELPSIKKEGYEFVGWYLNNNLYSNEQIYDNIVLNAEYKLIEEEISYKVGDRVKIIGNYSNSSKSLYAYNKRAIGWEREILNIMENSEFPYVIGNKDGVTGFFKEDSIKKI